MTRTVTLWLGVAVCSWAADPVVSGTVNGASFAAGLPLAAGSIASVFGSNLSLSAAAADVVPLPTLLGGARVSLNGVAAPLFYVSPGQINFQMPPRTSGATATIVVVKNGLTGLATSVELAPEAPVIFTLDSSGKGPGAVLNQDFSVNSAQNPAAVGDGIQIYANGLGALNPPVGAGEVGPSLPPFSLTVNTPTVLINGAPAEVLYSGAAPGFVGANQVNVRIPAGTPAGSAVSLQIKIGGGTSNIVTIAVR